VLLVLLSPLLLVIAIAIRLDTPGPILYRRRVIGQEGKPFMALKFRSMVANAHELLTQDPTLLQQYQQNLKVADDPRVTQVGRILRKTTLDELPQLINVLKGEMSLVGPRVLGDIELARFGEYGDKVLSVKPGMAGLWVASGRHTLPFERRVELEMEYIDRWSLWLDIKILLKSALAVIRMVGAE
jgi:lipopolysaccharide/colanic/teichoic acid biosynthesis glycosyltransferase